MILALAAALVAAQPAAAAPSPYDQAVTARLAGDNATAERILIALVADEPNNADAWVQYGYTLRAIGHPRDAEIAFRKALALAPDYKDASDGLEMLKAVPTTRTPYVRALEARKAGSNALAAEILKELVADEPGNADAWVQYGYALRALSRTDEAAAAFEHALAIAPDYKDAIDGLAFVRSDQRANPKVMLDADASYSWVGGGQPDWREIDLQARFEPATGRTLIARLEPTWRFGKSDVYGEVRGEVRVRDAYRFYALAGGTPGADFRAKARLGAGGSARLTGGSSPTVATLDTQWARYPGVTVWVLNPGLEQYISDGKAWLTGRMINLFKDGKHLSGWFARGDFQATKHVRLFVGAADAPDLAQGTPIGTRSLFGGIVADIDQDHLVRLSVARDDPDLGPKRTQASIGVGLRFR